MKTYIIQYEHMTGKRMDTYNLLFEFYQRLDELINDPYVSDDTISFYTQNNGADEGSGALFFESTEDAKEGILINHLNVVK